MICYNMIPLINKQRLLTRQSANTKDHIISNSATGHKDFESASIKTELSDHFLIVFTLKSNETTQKPDTKFTCKRSYYEKILTNL